MTGLTWESVVASGARQSVAVLSIMIGEDLQLGALKTDRVSIDEVSERVGGPEQSLTTIYLTYWGDTNGHMTLFFDANATAHLLERLTGAPHTIGDPFNEIERSALGEVGNVVGSAFLNSVSDATGLIIRPSPPDVIADMVGAVVDVIAADVLAATDSINIVEMPFRAADAGIEGKFLVVPGGDLIARIELATGGAA